MSEKLEELLKEASRKLSEAKDARMDVLDCLEEEYDLDREDFENYGWFEDECEWCYGFDLELIEELIKEKEKEVNHGTSNR